MPIENADVILLETPINGQIPRKYDSTKLLTIADERNIKNSSIIQHLLLLLQFAFSMLNVFVQFDLFQFFSVRRAASDQTSPAGESTDAVATRVRACLLRAYHHSAVAQVGDFLTFEFMAWLSL